MENNEFENNENEKEESEQSFFNTLNRWTLSDNLLAKFVRFIAKVIYSSGLIAGGLVTGVTDRILGKDVLKSEADRAYEARARRELDKKMKDMEKGQKGTEQEKNPNKDPDKENQETFQENITSEFSNNMLQDLGITAAFNPVMNRVDFYRDDDRKLIIGSLTYEQYINGASAALADVVLKGMLQNKQEVLQTDEIPQEDRNKADLYAAILQGSIFLNGNKDGIKQSYEQYCNTYGEYRADETYLRKNYSLGRCEYMDGSTKYKIELAYEPQCLQGGFSVYRNGEKTGTYSLEEIKNSGLSKITEEILQSYAKEKVAQNDREFKFGELSIQRSGEHGLLIVNEKKNVGYILPTDNAELMVSGMQKLKELGVFQDTKYENSFSSLLTVTAQVLNVAPSAYVNAPEAAKGQILNPVTGKYESLHETPYSMRKEGSSLLLTKYQKHQLSKRNIPWILLKVKTGKKH